MRDLRTDAERCNVQEESIHTTRKVHHPNIHAAYRGTARQRTRRHYRITRDASRSRVIATSPRWQQSERNTTERLNATRRIDAVRRLTR
jgi:hypothetical protein